MIIDIARSARVENEIARRGGLGLKRFGGELIGACVRCGGTDRFSVNIKKQIFNCRGCSASGDVIALTQHIDRCDFMTAVRTLDSGAEMAASRNGDNRQIEPRRIDLVNQAQIDGQNTERALKLWADAVPIVGTIAERYLHGRGLHDLPGDDVLRFHPSCPFGKSRVACLLALYTDIATNEPRAISRTAISAAGNKIGRMSLGPVGGAVVKIDGDENIESGLTIGEGTRDLSCRPPVRFSPNLVGGLGRRDQIISSARWHRCVDYHRRP